MNTVILTVILLFNGTTHHTTKVFGEWENLETNMKDCWYEGGKVRNAFAWLDAKIISIQCTVKNLKE